MVLADYGPLATGLAAVVALIVGIRSIKQKSEADRRDQWWKRAQWAIDHTFASDEQQRKAGYDVLYLLATSKPAGTDELAIFNKPAGNELPNDDPGVDIFSGPQESG